MLHNVHVVNVSVLVESICIWFFFLNFCGGLNVVLGVKASLTLGREEKPWGEGVSWVLHWS